MSLALDKSTMTIKNAAHHTTMRADSTLSFWDDLSEFWEEATEVVDKAVDFFVDVIGK